jgi:hypothetical protein
MKSAGGLDHVDCKPWLAAQQAISNAHVFATAARLGFATLPLYLIARVASATLHPSKVVLYSPG